jgi:hypothetical protein
LKVLVGKREDGANWLKYSKLTIKILQEIFSFPQV